MRTFRRTLSCSPALLLLGALACGDDETPPTGPTTRTAETDFAAAAVLSFRQISAGNGHTCGVTTGDQAYCWGDNGFSTFGGQLGDGTTIRRLKPAAVLGGLSFRQVSAGVTHTCAVTTDNRAYCWGRNDYGQLGDGTTESRLTPVPVAGGRRFRVVSAGNFHSCGITPSDVLFCWGSNRYGVLGTGPAGTNSFTPARVAGGHTWRNVSAGFSHTCGAATSGQGYCWGNNTNFQIGNGTSSNGYRVPTAVVGALDFRQVFVGSGFIADAGEPAPDLAHSCGLTTTDRVYCWGSAAASSTPREAPGGRRYSVIGVGHDGCGVTLAGAIYCWNSESIARVASGTLRFLRVSVSGIGAHRCAVAVDNKAYCWGSNSDGQLGNGSTNPSTTPVAVAAPE
jgi:alpha-tubulin suppressor-like RCC1 family protein